MSTATFGARAGLFPFTSTEHGLTRLEAAVTSSRKATVQDLKQLAWVVAILWGLVGILGILTRDYFERDTLVVALGLAAFVTVVFGLIVGASLLVAAIAGLGARVRRRWEKGKDGS